MSLLFVVQAVGVVAALAEAGYAGVCYLEGDHRSARGLLATSLGVLLAAILGPQM